MFCTEYLKIEAEARCLAAELEVEYDWKDIHFRKANREDREMIQELLQDEESIPTSSDWTVKLGTNLYYSANLAKSPSHNKEIPYNRVIYRAFGCNSSPNNSPEKLKTCERSQGRQKKIVIAGQWCGKVWMSNQVHPILAQRIEGSELEETDDSSVVEASKHNISTATAVTKSRKKRESMTLEETDTKRPKQTEEYSSRALKRVAQVSSPSPTGIVLRISSRVANRPNKVKSEMTEEEEDDTSHWRTGPPHKTEFEAGKKMKISRGAKKTALTAPKDEEEHPNSAEGSPVSSDAKWDLYPRKHRTRTEAKIQLKKATGVKKRTPRETMHVEEYTCSIEGCDTSFDTKKELSLHERDICPVEGCGKKFFTHRYLLQHHKVHTDHRPLKCPWEGCGMAFKWTWSRTEHLRVHTGDRPYVCHEPGCAQTFRFVSDFCRHKRNTGHSPNGKRTKA
jgi:hypothetical protein